MPRRLALTGTPGTGKTSVAREFALRGWGVLDIAAYAEHEDLVAGVDEVRGSVVLDEDRIAAVLAAEDWPEDPVVLDSHVAHLMPCEAVAVLRTEPRVLAERLRARGWGEAKVRENAEAEAMSAIAEEVEHARVVEVDTTERTPAEVADELARAFLAGPWPARRRIGWRVEDLPWV